MNLKNPFVIICVVICLPLLYVLSAFVLAYILKNGFGVKDAPMWFIYIYTPLKWLTDYFPGLELILEAIAKFFGI